MKTLWSMFYLWLRFHRIVLASLAALFLAAPALPKPILQQAFTSTIARGSPSSPIVVSGLTLPSGKRIEARPRRGSLWRRHGIAAALPGVALSVRSAASESRAMSYQRRINPVQRSLSRPLTILGAKRKLFSLHVPRAREHSICLSSLLGGLLMSCCCTFIARWATAPTRKF